MAVPLCTWLVCLGYEKKLSLKAIRWIVIVNGAVMWLILQVIAIERGFEGTSAAVFLWSALAQWMLKKKCLKKD